MTIIVCYAKCWPCQFGDHDETPHTWMDDDDRDHAQKTAQFVERYGSVMPTWEQLAESHRCGCRCQKRTDKK